MIRILIVDDTDVSSIIDEVGRGVDTSHGYDPVHLNPLLFLGESGPEASLAALLGTVGAHADSFLDVVAVDRNLGEFTLSNEENRHLALRIAETVRERNRSTAVMLYSGTFSDYLEESFRGGDRDGLLRRILRTEISNFFPRSRVAREICSCVANPSWLLRVDRMLMKHAAIAVSPEESEFKGRTFADLAKAVRCQDRDGQRIAELVAAYGVSCFADLNS